MTIFTVRRGKTEGKEVKVLLEDDEPINEDKESKPEIYMDSPMDKQEMIVAAILSFIFFFGVLAFVYYLFYAAPVAAHPMNFVHGNDTYEGYGLDPRIKNDQYSPIMGTNMAVIRTSEHFKNLTIGDFIIVTAHEESYLEGLWHRLRDIHIGWPVLGGFVAAICIIWHFKPIKVRDVTLTRDDAVRYGMGMREHYVLQISPEGEAATSLKRGTKVLRVNGIRVAPYCPEIVSLILNDWQENVTFTVVV